MTRFITKPGLGPGVPNPLPFLSPSHPDRWSHGQGGGGMDQGKIGIFGTSTLIEVGFLNFPFTRSVKKGEFETRS